MAQFQPNLSRARGPEEMLFGKPRDTRQSPSFQSNVKRGCHWLDKKKKAPDTDSKGKVRPSTSERMVVQSGFGNDTRPSPAFKSKVPKAVVFKDTRREYVVKRDKPQGWDEARKQEATFERLYTRGRKDPHA